MLLDFTKFYMLLFWSSDYCRYGSKMRNIFLIIAITFFSQQAYASQEGVLPFEEFHIKSKGIGQSGSVSVEGVKNSEDVYKKIVVHAFGQSTKIPNSILKNIPKFHNGIQLSYEEGYKELGGRTIYLQFQRGFTSGASETFTLSIDESGNIEVLSEQEP